MFKRKRQTEEKEGEEVEVEEDRVGIRRYFLIQVVRQALLPCLWGRGSYKTKISATKAAGGSWLRRRSTLGPNYLRYGNFPLFEGQMIN